MCSEALDNGINFDSDSESPEDSDLLSTSDSLSIIDDTCISVPVPTIDSDLASTNLTELPFEDDALSISSSVVNTDAVNSPYLLSLSASPLPDLIVDGESTKSINVNEEISNQEVPLHSRVLKRAMSFVGSLVVQESDYVTRSGRTSKKPRAFTAVALPNAAEPLTFSQYLISPDKTQWTIAMEKELKGLADNFTWELVDVVKGMKIIGNKWVWKIKYNPDGSVDKWKARLVALGNTQTEGVDYSETFAPVLHFNSFRFLLAIAAQHDLQLHQMDLTQAFLNGDLEETIYMRQPRGSTEIGPEKVCKLLKSLYGLKQAPRQWYKKMNASLLKAGFTKLLCDPCLYVKHLDNGKIHIIGLYVDDIIQATNCDISLQFMIDVLCSEYKMVIIGTPKKVLGIEIRQDLATNTICFGLESYTRAAITQYMNPGSYPVSTPQEVNQKLVAAKKDQSTLI